MEITNKCIAVCKLYKIIKEILQYTKIYGDNKEMYNSL
jgi:hypothetical protein